MASKKTQLLDPTPGAGEQGPAGPPVNQATERGSTRAVENDPTASQAAAPAKSGRGWELTRWKAARW